MPNPLDWLNHFPTLNAVEDSAWRKTVSDAMMVTIPPGQTVFREGEHCNRFLLVIEGAIRVQKLSETGREIVLYRVEEGQSCILTTACMLGDKHYHAEAYSETTVTAVVIPHHAFQHALNHSQGFRDFVFSAYGQRITDLLMLIESISFGRVDRRLAVALIEQADKDGVHQKPIIHSQGSWERRERSSADCLRSLRGAGWFLSAAAASHYWIGTHSCKTRLCDLVTELALPESYLDSCV